MTERQLNDVSHFASQIIPSSFALIITLAIIVQSELMLKL